MTMSYHSNFRYPVVLILFVLTCLCICYGVYVCPHSCLGYVKKIICRNILRSWVVLFFSRDDFSPLWFCQAPNMTSNLGSYISKTETFSIAQMT